MTLVDILKDQYALTEKELQVAMLVKEGMTRDEISRCLKRSPETIKSHSKSVLLKTGCKNQLKLSHLLWTLDYRLLRSESAWLQVKVA